jgi:hypothetical protein
MACGFEPHIGNSDLMEHSTEPVNGVPQIVRKISLDKEKSAGLAELEFSSIFDRLIIGPTQFPAAVREAFANELTAAGVPDAHNRVVASMIPLRT